MPEQPPPDDRRTPRSREERAADHAEIDRLTGELLPSLMARLGASGLGELEVREGSWRVRLRRPADGASTAAPRHGPARERRPGERGGERTGADRHPERHPERHGRGHQHGGGDAERLGASATRGVATSPAVGIYRPRPDLATGDRVRTGDRLGAIDMLGVPQEVLAPADGIVGATLVEAGDAVEYGQGLVVIEVIGAPDGPASTNGSGGPPDVP